MLQCVSCFKLINALAQTIVHSGEPFVMYNSYVIKCIYLVQEMVKLQVIAAISLHHPQSQVHYLFFELKLVLKLHKPLRAVLYPLLLNAILLLPCVCTYRKSLQQPLYTSIYIQKKASENAQGIKKMLFLIRIHYHKIFQLWWKLDSQLRILG